MQSRLGVGAAYTHRNAKPDGMRRREPQAGGIDAVAGLLHRLARLLAALRHHPQEAINADYRWYSGILVGANIYIKYVSL